MNTFLVNNGVVTQVWHNTTIAEVPNPGSLNLAETSGNVVCGQLWDGNDLTDPDPSIEKAKADKKEEVNRLRDTKLELDVTVSGDSYHSDLGTLLDLFAKKDRLAVGNSTVSSLTRSGDTATLTFADKHLLPNKTRIFVTGANETDYNVSNVTATRADSTSITFPVSNTPSTPATGSISVSIRIRVTLADNSKTRLTLNQFVNRTTSISEYRSDCYDNGRDHKDAIDLLTTTAEVNAYDITTGWPSVSL